MRSAHTNSALSFILTHSPNTHAPEKVVEDALVGGVVRIHESGSDVPNRVFLPSAHALATIADLVASGYFYPPLSSVPTDNTPSGVTLYQSAGELSECFAAVVVLFPTLCRRVFESDENPVEVAHFLKTVSTISDDTLSTLPPRSPQLTLYPMLEAQTLVTLRRSRSQVAVALLRGIDNAIRTTQVQVIRVNHKASATHATKLRSFEGEAARRGMEDMLAALLRLKVLLVSALCLTATSCPVRTTGANIHGGKASTSRSGSVSSQHSFPDKLRIVLGKEWESVPLNQWTWGTLEETEQRYDAAMESLANLLDISEGGLDSVLGNEIAALDLSSRQFGTEVRDVREAEEERPTTAAPNVASRFSWRMREPVSDDIDAHSAMHSIRGESEEAKPRTLPTNTSALAPLPHLLLAREMSSACGSAIGLASPPFCRPRLPCFESTLSDFFFCISEDIPFLFDTAVTPLASIMQSSRRARLTMEQLRELQRIVQRGLPALTPAALNALEEYTSDNSFISEMVEKHGNKSAFADLVQLCVGQSEREPLPSMDSRGTSPQTPHTRTRTDSSGSPQSVIASAHLNDAKSSRSPSAETSGNDPAHLQFPRYQSGGSTIAEVIPTNDESDLGNDRSGRVLDERLLRTESRSVSTSASPNPLEVDAVNGAPETPMAVQSTDQQQEATQSYGDQLAIRCIRSLPLGEPLCHVVRDLVQRQVLLRSHFLEFVRKGLDSLCPLPPDVLSPHESEAGVSARKRIAKLFALLVLNVVMRPLYDLSAESALAERVRSLATTYSDVRECRELSMHVDAEVARRRGIAHTSPSVLHNQATRRVMNLSRGGNEK